MESNGISTVYINNYVNDGQGGYFPVFDPYSPVVFDESDPAFEPPGTLFQSWECPAGEYYFHQSILHENHFSREAFHLEGNYLINKPFLWLQKVPDNPLLLCETLPANESDLQHESSSSLLSSDSIKWDQDSIDLQKQLDYIELAARLDRASMKYFNLKGGLHKTVFNKQMNKQQTLLCQDTVCTHNPCAFAHGLENLKPRLVGPACGALPCLDHDQTKRLIEISCSFKHEVGSDDSKNVIFLTIIDGPNKITEERWQFAKNIYILTKSQFDNFLESGDIKRENENFIINTNICIIDNLKLPEELLKFYESTKNFLAKK